MSFNLDKYKILLSGMVLKQFLKRAPHVGANTQL